MICESVGWFARYYRYLWCYELQIYDLQAIITEILKAYWHDKSSWSQSFGNRVIRESKGVFILKRLLHAPSSELQHFQTTKITAFKAEPPANSGDITKTSCNTLFYAKLRYNPSWALASMWDSENCLWRSNSRPLWEPRQRQLKGSTEQDSRLAMEMIASGWKRRQKLL